MYPEEAAWLWTIQPQIFTCVSWDTCIHKLQPCWSGGPYRSRVCPSLKSQHMILWKTILSKHQYYCQSDFENSQGMPKKRTTYNPAVSRSYTVQRFSYPLNLGTHLHPYFLPNGMWSWKHKCSRFLKLSCKGKVPSQEAEPHAFGGPEIVHYSVT